jgi:hypothetical protein
MSRVRRERRAISEGEQAVVLDKSFIRAASGRQVSTICETYRALMPEDLLMEIIHSDEETKALCFAKFPAKVNPVALMPPGGALMRYETEYRRPSTPIWERRLNIEYTFNKRLATGEFELTHQQLGAVRAWEEELRKETAAFVDRTKVIVNIIPALQGYRPGQDQTRIEEAIHDIASNMEGIRRFYEWAAPKGFPPASIVGRTWAVFRFMQVHLIADVEFLAKYGINVNIANEERLQNERTDLNYRTRRRTCVQ